MRRIPGLIVLVSLAAVWSAAADTTAEERVSAAVVAAVRLRMGPDASVIVETLKIFNPGELAGVDAAPDRAARLGGVVRFALTVQGRRAGHADARLRVSALQPRAVRFVPRGATLGDDDVVDVRGDIADGPLRPLPSAAALKGGRALRDLQAGAAIPAAAVMAPPAIRTGQTVTAVIRSFGVEATASMVAADSGNPGAIIRVVNRETRRALRARVISTEVVEIIHD